MKDTNLKLKSIKEFDKMSKYYDSFFLRWFFSYFYKKLFIYLKNLDNKKILSVGCGTGTLETLLAIEYKNCSVVGVDLSGKMLEVAKTKSLGIQNVSFVLGDAKNLEFQDESFDIIICSHSFHHYPNQIKALKEFYRVLKNNSSLIIVDAIKNGFLPRIWVFLIEHIFERGTHHFSSFRLNKIVKNIGFSKLLVKKISLGFYGILEAKKLN